MSSDRASALFWLLVGDRPTGPFGAADVKAKWLAGQVTPGTQVCRDGDTAWRPLHQVFRLPGVPTGLPPAPPAISQLGAVMPPATAVVSAVRLPSRRRWVVGTPVVVAAALVGLSLVYLGGRATLPGLTAGYKRGYADTILRYSDRSYDGAKWVKLKESAALATSNLFSIAGWDDDNFWVASRAGGICRMRGGVWRVECQLGDAGWPQLRPTSAEQLLVAGGHFYRVSAGEVENYGEAREQGEAELGHIFLAADDRFFYHGRTHGGRNLVRFDTSRRTTFSVKEDREASVCSADGSPVEYYWVEKVYCTRSHAANCGFGIAYKRWNPDGAGRLVRFDGKFWRMLSGDLPHNPRDLWLSGSEDAPTFVLAGDNGDRALGWVHVRRTADAGVDHRLGESLEPTSADLLRVWGVSLDKYWVMDTNGTVWQRDGTESRVVVRGMRRDKVEFTDAWVSPTGTVFAITPEHVWKLD